MSWFYVDDQFPTHRKLATLPPQKKLACVGLWTLAGAWCRAQNLPGEIPSSMLTTLGGSKALADLLVDCGLWERTPAGYVFHNWEDWQWQDTEEEAARKREQTRERVRRHRERKRAACNADVTRYGNEKGADVTHQSNACNGHVLGEGEGEGYVGVESKREGELSAVDVLEAQAVRAEATGNLGGDQ